jgi:uncharacterized protein YaaR (DUF327 family)
MELNQSIENPLGAGTQVGQAESFVYTPNQNVFATIQGALDKNLQLQQDNLKKKEEAKKKQDAEFEKIMMDLQVDPKWDKSLAEMSEHIDNVGDLVYKWRASGKPVDVNFYTALNKEVARQNQLKSMNEKTFDAYTKYKADALANEKVDQADVELWEKGLDAQKTIEDRFNYINNTPKPGEYFDILKPFKDYFSEEEQNLRLTKTDETKQAKAEKAVWESRNPTERERMLRLAGKNLQLTDKDGNFRPATEDEYLKFVHESMKPFYVKQQTPAPSSGGSGPSANKPKFSIGIQYPDSSKDASGTPMADTISLSTETMRDVPPAQFTDASGRQVTILPSKLVFSGTDWLIRGQEVGGKDIYKSADKGQVDAFLAQGVQNGTIADASQVTQDANGEYSFNYTKLKQVDVPYLQNKEIFQNKYGFDPYIEADKWNKSRNAGGSSSSPLNANTYGK